MADGKGYRTLYADSCYMVATHYITLSIANLWLLLLARIAVAALLYYIIMRLLNVAIFKECMQFILKKRR